MNHALANTLEVIQCILEKVVLGTRTVWGNTDDWHHVGVMVSHRVAVVATAGNVRIASWRLLTAVSESPRVDHDVAQFAFIVALLHGGAVVVVHVVDTIVLYGRQLLQVPRCGGFIAF